jgi:hypothetical protein
MTVKNLIKRLRRPFRLAVTWRSEPSPLGAVWRYKAIHFLLGSLGVLTCVLNPPYRFRVMTIRWTRGEALPQLTVPHAPPSRARFQPPTFATATSDHG